ncbi:MAG: type I restriction enzyme HsdR N-terminal domain-containing protein [Salinivirgaceae bacterium]|jgi:hypothetical protein|nr:type I restriction enzyme HsdR N-terminal domain-containing protein [Salinivirgaceae bacterium]
MQQLNLPDYISQLRINIQEGTIFDSFRKKTVKLTPEEWVRQNFLLFLKNDKNYSEGLLSVEMGLTLNNLSRRCDIVGFDSNGKARLIVECKAPKVKITQKTFDQIAAYNLKLQVDYLIVTNGLNHYCCKMNYAHNTYIFLKEIPLFSEMVSG